MILTSSDILPLYFDISAMTLIIIQVMRSSLYTTVDENLKTLSQGSLLACSDCLSRPKIVKYQGW